MNKETKSKCCGVGSFYGKYAQTNLCLECGKPFIPQVDTPVTPIEEKKLRYQINKIRNGCWRLEWEDGSFSEHSTQDGAEKMRMQIETSRASHPIEPSWVERFDEKVKELKDQRPSLYKIADVVEFGYSVDRDDELFRVVDFGNIKKFIHSVERAAEEKARREVLSKLLNMVDATFNYPCTCPERQIACKHKWSDDFYIIRNKIQFLTNPPITPKGTNQ